MTVESGESTSSSGQASGGHLDARWPEVVMAAFLFVVAILVIVDSVRVGTGWADDGPRSGYFPFYIGIIVMLASSATLVEAILNREQHRATPFLRREQEVGQLGFDARFMRIWTFYLAYCEAGFRSGNIDVRQMVFAKNG